MMPTAAAVHDHFVLLLDTQEFEDLPTWLTTNFTIIEGGTHAQGSSRNKLIVFKDGTYLELFNWIKQPLEFLAWADKKPGLIDFALTTMPPVTAEQNHSTASTNISNIESQHSIGVTYESPLAGGRKRGDGTEVKWKNSRPSFGNGGSSIDSSYFPNGRTDVPFFCHDVTDRTVRVQFDNEEITNHACGAVGIDTVEVKVPVKHANEYNQLFGAILDTKSSPYEKEKTSDHENFYAIGVPHPIDAGPVYVKISSTENNNDFFGERGIGISSITLKSAKAKDTTYDGAPLTNSGIGMTIKLKPARPTKLGSTKDDSASG